MKDSPLNNRSPNEGKSLLGLNSAFESLLREVVREEVEKILRGILREQFFSKPLLSVEELAAKLKVNESWIYERTRKQNGIPHIKVGKYPRFDYQEILSWLRNKD